MKDGIGEVMGRVVTTHILGTNLAVVLVRSLSGSNTPSEDNIPVSDDTVDSLGDPGSMVVKTQVP